MPGTAGNVFLAEAAGHFVEKGAGLILAFAERQFKSGLVLGGFGDLGGGLADDRGDAGGVFGLLELVEVVFAGAPVFDQASVLELRELGRYGALAESEDFLQFGDGKLFDGEKQENAEPIGVGEQAQGLQN